MTDLPAGAKLAITFLYYKDLEAASAFYRDVVGLSLSIDQGHLAKIFQIAPGAHLGLVDEAHGMNKWQVNKCVQVCLRVPDVDAWYAHAKAHDVKNLSEMFVNETIGIRAFVFDDPEGYQVEIQTSTKPDLLI